MLKIKKRVALSTLWYSPIPYLFPTLPASISLSLAIISSPKPACPFFLFISLL